MVNIRIRKNIGWTYFLYIVLVVCIFWFLGSFHDFIAKLFGIGDSVQLTLDSIASIVGIVAAALAIIISNRHQAYKEQQASRDQIYQQLELESNNLFRFEIENVELARITWEDGITTYNELQKNKDKSFQILCYICQILNLLEMAVRFRKSDIVHDDVFMSWEVWIYDLCKSDIFLNYWHLEGLRDNYIELFQEMIDHGLLFCHGKERVASIKDLRDTSEIARFRDFRLLIKQHLVV